MKLQLVSTLLFVTVVSNINGKSLFTGFDKREYYATIASKNIDSIDHELKIVQSSSIIEKGAYEGTLLMTKAGLVKKIAEKVNYFKAGRSELEASIKKNKTNAELRFLRLIIQENAPPIVNYKGNLKEDKVLLQQSFKTLSPDVQKCILDYCKRSKILDQKDF
ncbi:MAG TPA: hypothetical protein VK718_09460 [Ferruginibacter sp.]|jgi:hypothetical protein|nr:hypothetical protein [Ferruginibacter sp.]